MTAYLIARFDMIDPAAETAYPAYVAAAAPAFAAHHACFLARGGTAHPMEGPARSRNVVIEFSSVAEAVGCFRSDVYQAARRHRLPVAEGEVVIVEGISADRPAPSSGKGYWIARYDVRDPEIYKRYVEVGAPAFRDHEAVFLARGGPSQAMEGQARARNVLIEFPSVRHALDCYRSDVYQAARKHREPVSTGEIVIVEGVA